MPTRSYTAQRDEPQTRDITARTIELRADSVNEEGRSVEAVIATERQTAVRDMQTWQIIDEILMSRGLESSEDVPLLDNHSRYSLDDVMGSARSITVAGDTITARLHFHQDESQPEIERAWKKVKAGHLRNVSAGYSVREAVEIPPGKTADVDGKRYTAGRRPLRVATRWALREVSLVPVGADSAARIRREGGHEMPPKLREYLEGLGLRKDATDAEAWAKYHQLTDQQRAECAEHIGDTEPPEPQVTRNAPPATPPQDPPPVIDPEVVRREGAEQERQRQSELRSEFGTDAPELLQRALSEGWSLDEARPHLLSAIRRSRASAADGRGPAIHSRGHEQDCTSEVLETAMCLRSGVDIQSDRFGTLQGRSLLENHPLCLDINNDRRQQVMERAWRYRSLSMADMAREAIRISGGHAGPGTDGVLDVIRTSPSSSSAVLAIYTTNINASVLMGYMDAPDTTSGWVSEADVADFKINERIAPGKFGPLTLHARGSVADHMDTFAQMEPYKIHRYSGKFTVDEQDIIDDRFGAIEQMAPSDIGNAAAQLRPDMVYAALLANANLTATGTALFATTHGGTAPSAVSNTATTVLSEPNLQAAISQMSLQRIRNRPLNIRPRYLIVPPELVWQAQILLQSAQRIIASGSGGTFNPLANQGITVVSDARLSVAGVIDPATGTPYAGLATNWYLSARPGESGAKTIEVGYLRGSGRAPTIRPYVLNQGQWGVGWDIKMDLGVKPLDFRGLFRSTGAG